MEGCESHGASVGTRLCGTASRLRTLLRLRARCSPETERKAIGMPHVLRAQAAEEFGDDAMAGRLPSIRVIRTRLHMRQPRAQLVRAYLGTLVAA